MEQAPKPGLRWSAVDDDHSLSPRVAIVLWFLVSALLWATIGTGILYSGLLGANGAGGADTRVAAVAPADPRR